MRSWGKKYGEEVKKRSLLLGNCDVFDLFVYIFHVFPHTFEQQMWFYKTSVERNVYWTFDLTVKFPGNERLLIFTLRMNPRYISKIFDRKRKGLQMAVDKGSIF